MEFKVDILTFLLCLASWSDIIKEAKYFLASSRGKLSFTQIYL